MAGKSWEHSMAKAWSDVIINRKVVKVVGTTWPRICPECHGDELESCWKCQGTGEEEPEPAIKIIFSNGAELLVRSEYAAALFIKKD